MITKEELITILKDKVVTVKFKKKDDTVRKMICTLSKEYLPEFNENTSSEDKTSKKENINVLPVWDIEKLAWRSFRVDSILEYDTNY